VIPTSPGWAYRLLALGLAPFWLLHALRHGRKHGQSDYLSLRLGGIDRAADPPRLWVHASSVGEVNAVIPLVEALLERGESILFTSFTATGYQAITQAMDDRVTRGIIPIDCITSCRKFFRNHRIKLGLITETELWPELLFQASRREIPLLLVNARLSAKSSRANAFVRGLLGKTLTCFGAILARSGRDRDALLALGAEPEKISVLGNLKSQRGQLAPPQRLVERDYLLLASSHAGEEKQFLENRPGALQHKLLVIAPRHPQRSAEIEREIASLGLRYALRSKADRLDSSTEVYLADTLGELTSLMAFAQIVVMGGSFDRTGGHNLIEAASLGCATITGPSDSNIREDIDMLGDGIEQVQDMAQCWRLIEHLLQDPARTRALGRKAQARLDQQPDVIGRYLETIEQWL